MYRGKIIGELPAGADAQEIGLLMAGSDAGDDRRGRPRPAAGASVQEGR